MDLGIKGKRAFVAASSQGLGRAVAEALIHEGVDVIINGRNQETLSKTTKELSALTGGQVTAIQGDLSNVHDRSRIIEMINEEYGRVDILVTNTGGPPAGKFEDFAKQDWDDAYELLLGSAVDMINGFLPGMKERGWGRIISITSIAVKQPVANLILSNAVRASVSGLIKSLSNEVGEFNITVNNVLPGFTDTERLRKLHENNPNFDKLIEGVPLKRVGKPEEFGATVCFLASEKAAYITGVSLPVDGGAIKGLL